MSKTLASAGGRSRLERLSGWLASGWLGFTKEITGAAPGDPWLQFASIVVGFIGGAYFLADIFFVLRGVLSPGASIVILLLAATVGGALGATFCLRALGRNLALFVLLFIIGACAAHWIVDVTYDGQDYQYSSIWALVNGWNPYHNRGLGHFGDFVAPGSDEQPWAFHFPKAHWIFASLQVSAGLSYEAAKTEPLLLLAASFAGAMGAARRFGVEGWQAYAIALPAALNPLLITELFSRMNDGVMAGIYTLFVGFGLIAAIRGERRAWIVLLVLMATALNTKQSALVILPVLCAWLCLLSLIHRGWRVAAARGALLAASGLASLFIVGADPYLRNQCVYGNIVYPMRGSTMVIDDEFRPPELFPHSEPVRLAMSILSETNYNDYRLKLPLTVTPEEFDLAGDPEVHLAGLGPWFSAVFLLGLVASIFAALQRLPLRSTASALLITGGFVAFSAFVMPESWAVRYVPQLWLVPVLFAAAAAVTPRLALLAWLCGIAIIGNLGILAVSTVKRQGGASIAIATQIARFRDGKSVGMDPGASPARMALLEQHGLRVTLFEDKHPHCTNVERMPLAYDYLDDGTRPAIICTLTSH